MDGKTQSRRRASSTSSGPVLQEAQRFVNRTPETACNNDDSGRSSVTKHTSNLRGLSIDMSLVFSDESSDIQSEKQPYDECFSPLSEDSTMQPLVRPRPPMSAKNTDENAGNNPQVPSSKHGHLQQLNVAKHTQSQDKKAIKPSQTVMSSRRAMILAKVSSRITRLRQDKKLNDRFTVPKMDDLRPQALPELQDLCVEEPEIDPATKPHVPTRMTSSNDIVQFDPAKSSTKEPPGRERTHPSSQQKNPEQLPKKGTTEPKVQQLSFRTTEEPSIHCRTVDCETSNPSLAMSSTASRALDSIPEEKTIPENFPANGKPLHPQQLPPLISTEVEKVVAPNSIGDCRTEPDTPQMTNCTMSSHTQQLQDLKICVDAYSHSQYLELIEALSMNRGVRTVSVIRKHQSEGIRTRRPADLDHLFHVLHSLSASLSELYLWNFRLQDLTSLSLGLYDHESIQHLQLHMETGTLDESAARALGTMPQLVSLELEVNESFALWPLVESNSLTVLSIVGGHFVFDASHILDASDKLETNGSLQILDLEPRMPAWCLVTLVTSIRSCPNCSLETFQFSCKPNGVQDGDACMLEIIKLIKSKQSKLRVVWNHCAESFEVCKDAQNMAMSALYVCDAMHQFHVFLESDEYSDLKQHVLDRNVREAVERDSGNMYEL